MRRLATVTVFLLLLGAAFLLWSGWRGAAVPVFQVQRLPLEQWVVATGQVRYQSLARIGAEITGTVERRHVREGDAVQPGDPLVSLRRDELEAQYRQAQTALAQLQNQLYPQAVQSLQEARLAWQQAEREAQRRSRLATSGMLSEEQAEQARHLAQTRKTALGRAELAEQALKPGGDEERMLTQRLDLARANLDKTLIRAPFAGRVQTRSVEPGDQVQPGKVLLEIARLDGLEIIAAVDEKYMAPLALGQAAVVIADAWPGQELAAQVSFLAPTVDEGSGTLDVHLTVTDDQELLRQGMTVSVSVLTARKDNALAIPRDHLQQGGQGWHVHVLEDGEVRDRPVITGLQASTRVEILEGLDEGDLLVLPEDLPTGSPRLRAVLQENP